MVLVKPVRGEYPDEGAAWPFVAADVTGLYMVCLLFSFEVGSVCGASDMTPIEFDAGGGGCVFGSGGAEELANDESLLTFQLARLFYDLQHSSRS